MCLQHDTVLYSHRQQCYAINEYKHLEDIESITGTIQARRCLLPQLGEDSSPIMEEMDDEQVDYEQMHRSNDSLFVDDEQDKSGSPSTTKIAMSKLAAGKNEFNCPNMGR